jgi:hypothetical protein
VVKRQALFSSATDVAEMVVTNERAFDEAIELQCSLIGRTSRARIEAGLPAAICHSALERMTAALSATVQARTEFLAAHAAFADMARELRMPTGFGSGDGCPDQVAPNGSLRVAA